MSQKMPNTEYLKKMGKHNLESRENFFLMLKTKQKNMSLRLKKTLMVSDMGYKDLLHPS